MQKFLEHIEDAEKTIIKIDHLIYISYPLVRDKRLLLKAVVESKKAIASCINAVLQYEYLYRRVKISDSPTENLHIFIEKCAPKYLITEKETKLLRELFEVARNSEKSPFEFVKDDRLIILSETLQKRVIAVEKIKEFLILTKNILKKSKAGILG